MADIAKSKEALEALKGLVDAAAKAMEDGKVGFSDIKLLPSIVSNSKVLVSAVPEIKAELQDLSKEELQELVGLALDVGLDVAKKFGVEV